MRKQLIKISLLGLSLAFAIYSCKDDSDTTAPSLVLAGDNPYILENIGDDYVEPGFTATDDEDGNVAGRVTTTDNINEDSAGTYHVDYSVTDNAGNTSTAERSVIVQNSLQTDHPEYKGVFAANYACTSGPGTYNDTLTFSSTINNRLWFTRFDNYINGKVYATILSNGTSVQIPAQTVVCGNPSASRLFSGTGTISTSAGVTTMTLTISETTNGTTDNCTLTYTK